ncbi:uncharacterized protein [Malus domestica]|uniref:uncharacterized protein n=1 Tax=Malus domestica TaxID=3750 RepID=UPI003975D768
MSSSRRLYEIDEQQKKLLVEHEEFFNLEEGEDEAFAMEEDEDDEHKRRRFRMQRSLFNKIMITICNHDPYFVQKKEDAFHVLGLLPEQKITAALQMLAYRASGNQVDEIVRMGKSTIMESLMRFCSAIEALYCNEYLRKPTTMDMQRLLKKGQMRGFPSMIGSIDCMYQT